MNVLQNSFSILKGDFGQKGEQGGIILPDEATKKISTSSTNISTTPLAVITISSTPTPTTPKSKPTTPSTRKPSLFKKVLQIYVHNFFQ